MTYRAIADNSSEASARLRPRAHSPCPAIAQAKPKVVVIGGGPGGATVAKYVAKDSDGAIEVTLVEPAQQFVTCFHSNLYLGGFRTFQVDHPYLRRARVEVRREACRVRRALPSIDKDKKTVRLANGTTLPYDRLVIAPGIDIKFDSVPGYSEAASEKTAACLEGRTADAAAQAPARCAEGRRDHRDDRAAQSLSLPARALRARVDDGACAEGEGPQEIEDHHHRSEGEFLQAGPVRGRLAEALSRHGRVAGSENAWRREERRSEDA